MSRIYIITAALICARIGLSRMEFPLDDESIISAEEAATSPFATMEQVTYYESLLSHARGLHRIYPSQARITYLGEQLSQYATIVRLPTPQDMEASSWLSWMGRLVKHERDDFAEFYNYYAKSFHPQIFHWPLDKSITWLHEEWYDRVLNHSQFAVWQPAFRNGHSFLPDVVPTFINLHPYRVERVQKVHHMMVLYEAIGLHPSHFDQIVEFGGGTGDLVPTLREMGFSGSHFVVDLEPMLLLQQYFLRYSSWPVYLSAYLPTKQNRSTFLVSSMSTDLSRLLDTSVLTSTCLIATWSLTEAPSHVRDTFLSSVRGIGVILLAFMDGFATLDNVPWIETLIHVELASYSICIWTMPEHSQSSYLIARHISLGDVACSAVTGCTQATLRFGRNCAFKTSRDQS